MKTNKNCLPIMSVQGCVDHPGLKGDGYWVGYDGWGRISMSVGGITYNYKIGDCCMGIAGDHIEPGVSIKHPGSKENNALMAFACIGNKAKVISGDAKGSIGYVTGKHGGIDHVMIYFDDDTLDKMTCDDRILIKACGQGLKLDDHEDIQVMNLDPELLDKLNIQETAHGLRIPVKTIIPAYLMGSGLGSTSMMNGDYDIMTQDKQANQKFHLNELCFGDLVAIEDHDNHHGPHYLKGAISIGVVVHSDSFTSGHGPGLTIILTSESQQLLPVIDQHANIAEYLGVK